MNAGVSLEDDKRCYTAHLTGPHQQHSTLFAIREFYSAGPVWQTMGVVDEAKALRRGGGEGEAQAQNKGLKQPQKDLRMLIRARDGSWQRILKMELKWLVNNIER